MNDDNMKIIEMLEESIVEINEKLSEIETEMCNIYCKYPKTMKNQNELEKVCDCCPLQRIR